MTTIKEIKKELDDLGIEYKETATKSQLEWLLDHLPEKEEAITTASGSTIVFQSDTKDPIVGNEKSFHGFRDPNATPGTQAK